MAASASCCPPGWHLTHGKRHPGHRADSETLGGHVRGPLVSGSHCVCDTPHVANFPRDGAFCSCWEYSAICPATAPQRPGPRRHFRIGGTPVSGEDCAPSDNRLFREGDRGFQVQIYLGPDAPASARAQIAAILNSWRVTSVPA